MKYREAADKKKGILLSAAPHIEKLRKPASIIH
jgi:hypothetical protein